jgi:hypothetical protein
MPTKEEEEKAVAIAVPSKDPVKSDENTDKRPQVSCAANMERYTHLHICV